LFDDVTSGCSGSHPKGGWGIRNTWYSRDFRTALPIAQPILLMFIRVALQPRPCRFSEYRLHYFSQKSRKVSYLSIFLLSVTSVLEILHIRNMGFSGKWYIELLLTVLLYQLKPRIGVMNWVFCNFGFIWCYKIEIHVQTCIYGYLWSTL